MAGRPITSAFIVSLADTGSVSAAAAAVNMGCRIACMLYENLQGASFRAAWDHAMTPGMRRVHDIAIDRMLNGVVTPIIDKGEQVGECRVHSNTLLTQLLRFHADGPEGSPVLATDPGHGVMDGPTSTQRHAAQRDPRND